MNNRTGIQEAINNEYAEACKLDTEYATVSDQLLALIKYYNVREMMRV